MLKVIHEIPFIVLFQDTRGKLSGTAETLCDARGSLRVFSFARMVSRVCFFKNNKFNL